MTDAAARLRALHADLSDQSRQMQAKTLDAGSVYERGVAANAVYAASGLLQLIDILTPLVERLGQAGAEAATCTACGGLGWRWGFDAAEGRANTAPCTSCNAARTDTTEGEWEPGGDWFSPPNAATGPERGVNYLRHGRWALCLHCGTVNVMAGTEHYCGAWWQQGDNWRIGQGLDEIKPEWADDLSTRRPYNELTARVRELEAELAAAKAAHERTRRAWEAERDSLSALQAERQRGVEGVVQFTTPDRSELVVRCAEGGVLFNNKHGDRVRVIPTNQEPSQ